MMRLIRSVKAPIFMSIFPFTDINEYDKPVSKVLKPTINDEMGWDRVKKIFFPNETGMFTKELQSIINITTSGIVIGTFLGGMSASKDTVNNFISSNEATRFLSHFDAKRALQQSVFVSFIKRGGKLGVKLGLFCLMFSSITTCTTAYRGKFTTGNYILGGSITGFLFKIYLGPRAGLVGTGVGGILGGICGSISQFFLYLAGVNMDQVLDAQQQWINSRNQSLRDNVKHRINNEVPEIKEMFDENQRIQSSLNKNVKNS